MHRQTHARLELELTSRPAWQFPYIVLDIISECNLTDSSREGASSAMAGFGRNLAGITIMVSFGGWIYLL